MNGRYPSAGRGIPEQTPYGYQGYAQYNQISLQEHGNPRGNSIPQTAYSPYPQNYYSSAYTGSVPPVGGMTTFSYPPQNTTAMQGIPGYIGISNFISPQPARNQNQQPLSTPIAASETQNSSQRNTTVPRLGNQDAITFQISSKPRYNLVQSQSSGVSRAQSVHANQMRKKATTKRDWPPSLGEYVKRAFAKCQDDKERNICEANLKRKIKEAVKSGRMKVIDWASEPLPSRVAPFSETPTRADESKQIVFTSPSTNTSFALDRSPVQAWQSTPTVSAHTQQPVITSVKYPQAPLQQQSSFQQPIQNRWDNRSRFPPVGEDSRKTETQQFVTTRAARNKRAVRQRKKEIVLPKSSKKRRKKVKSVLKRSDFGEDKEEKRVIIGTSTSLEKSYFRLTSAPDPSNVRPENVLKKSLHHHLTSWREGEHDYLSLCEQLKSIRQDLTIQHIRSPFTVEVYEVHARVALENEDFDEYSQCNTQLQSLYAGMPKCRANEGEFICYSVLNSACLMGTTKNITNITEILKRISVSKMNNKLIRYSMSVLNSISRDEYITFFKLSHRAPKHGKYILKRYFPQLRRNILITLLQSFRGSLPLEDITSWLGFEDTIELRGFLEENNLSISGDNGSEYLLIK